MEGGGGGGPAPFLAKTYEMVDDSSTDGIVSWSSTGSSFVVWDPPEFSRLLLPSYFKHSNFSSFIRQLNTYGFRKIDPERWEFSNEEFVKGKKYLLKNIHRRKPIHSHSHPPTGSGVDPERAALEDEIERLSREKAALQAELWRFQQHETGTKSELDDLGLRVLSMEQRQQKMAKFLEKAVQNPTFVEHLILTAEASSNDPSLLNKKRRQLLSDGDHEHTDRSLTNSQTSPPSAPEFGHMFPRDFCSKLNLELSPTISDGNIMSVNSQSSNEDAGSPHRGQLEATRLRTECSSFAPKVAELVDTGASLCPRKNVWQTDHLSCHLNLTLASSLLQSAKSEASEKGVASKDQNTDGATELRSYNINSDCDIILANGNEQQNGNANAKRASSKKPATTNNPAPSVATGRVNDVFWEQFLTERPGSTTAEEASSSLRANPQEERPEERKLRDNTSWTNRKGMEKLTL